MSALLEALRASVDRLPVIVASFDAEQLGTRAYPEKWTIADVLSHLGSGAVIFDGRLGDAVAGRETPSEFAPSVWDLWNAKAPADQAAEALVADSLLMKHLEALTDDERGRVSFSMGPMNLDLAAFAGLRLNEHALHSWDIAVVLDPTATLPADVTSVAIDNLAMITRFVGKPIGVERSVHVRTAAPARDFQLVLAAESVSLSPLVIGDDQAAPDLVISAEAFIRLVYGRLDPNHAPQGDHSTLLDDLRRVFPGF